MDQDFRQKMLRLKKGQRVAFYSVVISLGLAVMKGVVGVMFHSQVLVADAVHSAADLMTHAASGFGLWIAARGKTDTFPYGLYRAETLATLVVGILITLAGAGLFREGLEKIVQLEHVAAFPVFPITAAVISCLAGYVIARMESRVGQAIGSRSLIASSREAYLDIYTSLAVLLGIVLAYYRIPYAEGAIIVLISLLLVKIGVENVWIALLILLDANLDPALQSDIRDRVLSVKGVKGVGAVKIRQSGPFKMVECILFTRPSLSLYQVHDIADQVENAISCQYPQVESFFIHVEPDKGEILKVFVPVRDKTGPEYFVHDRFAKAPFYLLLEVSGAEDFKILECCENIYLGRKDHIGVKTSHLAVEREADLVLTARIGEISFHMLNSNMIDVYRATAGRSVKDTLDDYHSGRLELLTEPVHLIREGQIFKSSTQGP